MKDRHRRAVRALAWIAFIIYIFLMVHFLFFSERFGRTPSDGYRYNIVPFAEIGRYVRYGGKIGNLNVILNLAGNVICFMPFGFMIPALSGRRGFVRVALLCLLCSGMVEVIQLVSKLGSCDIDDVILNTLGGMLGYMTFCVCSRFVYRLR